MRTCQCGGIIRESGKPFWDILPSCTCQDPVMIRTGTTITTDNTGNISRQQYPIINN